MASAPSAPKGGAGGPKAPAGHWTLNNAGQWVVIHATGPGKWAAGPKPGHPAPGFNYLNPPNPSQMAKQAAAEVRAAYKPEWSDINNQAQAERQLNAKQMADNQFYTKWLDAKTAALQAQQAQVDQSTNALEQRLTGAQLSSFGSEQPGLTAAADARAGNVSNNAQSNAFGTDLAASQQGQELQLGGSAQHALGVEDIANAASTSAIANTGATLMAGAAKEKALFDATMTKIANAKSVLGDKEAGAILKEVARLQGVATNVQINNRNYTTAVQKLALDRANINSEITKRANDTALGKARLQFQMNDAQVKAMESDRMYQLDVQKYDSAVAKDLYERQHGLGPYKPSKNGTPALSLASQNVIYSRINRTAGEINGLLQIMSPQKAYQTVLNGGYTDANGKWHHVTQESDQSLLNAAYNIRSGGPGLNSGDTGYLSRLGLTDIGSRLRVSTDTAANWRT